MARNVVIAKNIFIERSINRRTIASVHCGRAFVQLEAAWNYYCDMQSVDNLLFQFDANSNLLVA